MWFGYSVAQCPPLRIALKTASEFRTLKAKVCPAPLDSVNGLLAAEPGVVAGSVADEQAGEGR